MMLKSIMIVKDKLLANQLAKNIENNKSIELTQSSSIPLQMISNYVSYIDVVFFEVTENSFIDIQKVLKLSRQFKSIVLIVSSENHFIRDYDLSDIEVLFCPINIFHFDIIIHKITKKTPPAIQHKFMNHGDFVIKDVVKKEYVRCHYGEVVLFEIADKTLKIHTVYNGRIESNIPLNKIEKWLEPVGIFYRVHKSFIISAYYIQGYAGDFIRMKYYDNVIKLGALYRKDFDEYSASISIPTG